jgi:mono/diheme cytochrome c family protein
MLGQISGTRAVVIVGAIIILSLFALAIAYSSFRRPRREGTPDIPPAMKPGPTDAVLEKSRFERMLGWGTTTVIFLAIWVPLVWLIEPGQNKTDQATMNAESIQRGSMIVQLNSPTNPEGFGCVRCHGGQLQGWFNVFNGSVVTTPDLQTVCGGPFTGHPQIKSLDDVVNTIAQGRPGTDMPSWSVKFSGSLDDQQINDIVNYILSIQKVPFKNNVCINPQAAAKAAGGSSG